MPVVAPVHLRQIACSSQNAPNLLRGVNCHVTRPLTFSHVRSEYIWPFGSALYRNVFGFPAFALAKTPAMRRVLPCVRALMKYQTLSCLIGPPIAPFRSYTFVSGVAAARPCAASSGVTLLDCSFSPVPVKNTDPETLLP